MPTPLMTILQTNTLQSRKITVRVFVEAQTDANIWVSKKIPIDAPLGPKSIQIKSCCGESTMDYEIIGTEGLNVGYSTGFSTGFNS